jgi:hypothetical protein
MGMKRVTVLAGTFFLLCGVSGCGGDASDKLFGEMVANIQNTGQELSKITTNDDAKAHAKRLTELATQLKQLKEQASGLKNPPDAEERKRLVDKYNKKLREAIEKERAEWERIEQIPDVRQTLAEPLRAFREVQ